MDDINDIIERASKITLPPETQFAGELYRKGVALADAGEFDEAVAIAEEIGNSNFRLKSAFRNELLVHTTAACAEVGKIDDALQIAERVQSPYKSAALYWIVVGCVKNQQADRARSLIDSIEDDHNRQLALKAIGLPA